MFAPVAEEAQRLSCGNGPKAVPDGHKIAISGNAEPRDGKTDALVVVRYALDDPLKSLQQRL